MFKRGILVGLLLIIVMLSWEGSLEAKGIIPDDAIRIRILANSDSVQDQWIKRQVRDAIITQTKSWVNELQGKDAEYARQFISAHLPEIDAIVEQTLHRFGFQYGAEVHLGQVPFPAKQFGKYIYPEQEYDALLIVLGEGAGKNWWCVLFPPLCFIDGTTSSDYPQQSVDNKDKRNVKQTSVRNSVDNATKSAKDAENTDFTTGKVKPKLFIVELWKKWF